VYHNVTRNKRAPVDEPPKVEPGPEPGAEPGAERKERVIHTRVPERLEAQLRQRAEDLGISVSNLVRNVLGHAFGLVGDVVADSHAIARAARGAPARSASTPPPPAPHPPPPPSLPSPPPSPMSFDDVLGWQPIVLGKNAVCVRCNAILPRGTDAAVGLGTQLVACLACLEELRR
jgi:pyruvate/2-oxoglutarate dehydrogenase complex dihydrolipoamide acyltransferase (E2) component